MQYCLECGTKLELKFLENEGQIHYCPKCQCFRFEPFNTAISVVIVTKDFAKTLLIEQYGKKRYILVAGYVNKGESAEEAVRREIAEEVGLEVVKLMFQKTHYYEKTNTLMLNYIAVVKNDAVQSNYEIDSYKWFSLNEALENIAPNSLAKEFYEMFYMKVKSNEI